MSLETVAVVLFPILFAMVLAWFVLVKMLCSQLERDHPDEYLAMGRPSLFLRNSPAGVFATLKFLILREHRLLNDSALSKLSMFMLWFMAAYLALLVVLFVSIGLETARHAGAA